MATRAIRYDQLKTDSARTASEGIMWANYNHNDTEIWHPLQVAVQHQIENAGETAADIQNNISHIRNEQYSSSNYYGLMNAVYGHLLPHIIRHEMNQTLQTLMREKLIEMRDVAKAKTTTTNPYYDGRSDSDFTDPMHEMTRAMSEFSREINQKYFSQSNTHIITCNVHTNCVDTNTTDDEIDDMIDITTGEYRSMWRINTYYLLHGGYQSSMVHQYPQIPDDIMETFIENLIENHPAIALRIAQNDQFFQDNPMAQSVGHSWTSRNRSDDCWFKVSHDQVIKNNTVVFAPPRTFFGKFTPSLWDMTNHMESLKEQVINFIKSAEPKINAKVDAANVLTDKTEKSAHKAIIGLVQGLLDDADTVDVGTAIVGHMAGIARLPIDASSFPNGRLQYTYHDFTRKQDLTQYIYPQHIKGIVSLTAFNITDEVQQTLYQSYQENLQQHREIHANQCAQLARQIAQQTTRHDAEMKVITDAFTEYQTQV